MPYIPKWRREILDPIVNMMADKVVGGDGDLNYVLFKFAKYHVPHNYNSIKNYCAELNECANEIRRRILAPYEDERKNEHGEI